MINTFNINLISMDNINESNYQQTIFEMSEIIQDLLNTNNSLPIKQKNNNKH